MIVFVRTAGIAPGKTAAAIGFAHEIAAYFKSNFGTELVVLSPIGGNPQRIAWSTRYKDLAAMEAVRAKSLADHQYLALTAKATGHFVGGSLNDVIWQTI